MDVPTRRLQVELRKAEVSPTTGLHLKSWHIRNLLLSVAGPEETPFEGGLFEVEVQVRVSYPFQPPSLWFKTKVWHPNVCSTTGEVCLIGEDHSPAIYIMDYMKTLQSLLAQPKLENATNLRAARQYRENRDVFNRMARDWTTRNAKLGLSGNDVYTTSSVPDPAEGKCGGCGLSMDPVDHRALSDLFMTNRDPTARATRHGWGVGVTSLSGWYYAFSLHDNGRLACLNLSDQGLEGELTPRVANFVALTHLYLAGNDLTGAILMVLCNIQTLQVLDLSRNQLEGHIPENLSNLRSLRVLHLHRNRLKGVIPRELCYIRALQALNLSGNQLEGRIPEYLGDLNALWYLNLSENRLIGVVPSTLSKIGGLEVLFLQGNKLTGLWDLKEDGDYDQTPDLPDALSQHLGCLARLEKRPPPSFSLDDNPWTQPPETIVKMGMKASREYFEALYADHSIERRTNLKVVLVGHDGAGKTSLRQSIREQRPTPTEGVMESTVHIDIENVELDGTTVRFYDCAGQVAYTGLLQTFLTPRSLILLVCDAAAFGQKDESLDDDSQLDLDIRSLDNLRVCSWLRSLSFRVPYSTVILVATKCDLVRRKDTANIAARYEDACSNWLQAWVKGSIKGVRIEPGVSLTSCAMDEGKRETESWSCDWGVGETVCGAKFPPMLQHRITRDPNDELRGATQVLPRSWDIAFTVLDALGEGRNPVIAARKRYCKDGDEQRVPQKGQPYKGITDQQLKHEWLDVVRVLEKEGASIHNPEEALEWALIIRESEGSIVRHQTYVFLDVIWLAKILKPLLNHKVRENANFSITLGGIGDSLSPVTLTDMDDIRSWETLKEHGILEPRLAKAVWGDLSKYVLDTLRQLGLTFPLNNSKDDLVVLLRLPTERPQEVGEEIDHFREDHYEVFRVRWKMGLGAPPGAVEKVLTRCCRIGVPQTFWRFGVLVRGGSELALIVEYDDNNELEIRVYGNVYSSASWAVLSYALSAVKYMTSEFPGLQWRAWLDCPQPQHGNRKHEICHHTTRPGDNLLLDSGCNRCHPEIGGLGVAAVKLLQMVDINEDKDNMFQGVEERFNQSRHQFKELRPEGLRAQRSTSVRIRIMTSLNSVDPENLQELRQIKNILKTLQLQQPTLSSEWIEKVESVIESYNGLMGKVDFLVAMVMAERADKINTPRMACVLPPWEFSNKHGLTEEEMAVERWTERYGQWQDGDFKEGKGFLKTEMRLFLLCAHSKELVPCGHEGHGYRVVRSRKWVRQTARLANFLYTLASPVVQLGPLVGAAANTVAKATVDYAVEKTAVGDKPHFARELRGGNQQYELKGEKYDFLRKFLHEMELRTHLNAQEERQSFENFENVMVQVQARSGDAQAQWVLKKNKQAWLDAH